MLEKAAQGDPIRGLGILPVMLRQAADGAAVLGPDLALSRETISTALVDGGENANGGVVCRFAMALAIEKASTAGVSWVSTRNFHWNLGPLLKMATNRDLIGIVMSSSIPSVAPWGGAIPLLGNAPTGIAIPTKSFDPIIVDLSLTNTSSTPVAVAARSPEPTVPAGFILDELGQPTTDARDYLGSTELEVGVNYIVRGSLVPLGGPLSGHKGYALLFALNVLATVLSGAEPPWALQNGRATLGTQIVVVDPARFVPIEQFKLRVDEFIETSKAAKISEGMDDILYPGERSQRLQRERLATGRLSIPQSHRDALADIALRHGVSPEVLRPAA
jgi:LDH2 family malate/lactate/ureidoglycolate dehydrogenase